MNSKISNSCVALLLLAVAACNGGASSSARPSVLAANTSAAETQAPSAPSAPAAGTPATASPGSPAAPAATTAPASQDSPSGDSTNPRTAPAAPTPPASGAALSLPAPLEVLHGGAFNYAFYTSISVQFKDAAGRVHILFMNAVTPGRSLDFSVPGLVRGTKVVKLEVDQHVHSDLPTWRQLARQLKTAKGFATPNGGTWDVHVADILSCVRGDEDGAPDCTAPRQ